MSQKFGYKLSLAQNNDTIPVFKVLLTVFLLWWFMVILPLQQLGLHLRQPKFHLHRAQTQTTIHANVNCKPSKFKLGDLVYLKIQPHRQNSIKILPKFSAHFYGPYLVLKQIDEVAFKLQFCNKLEFILCSTYLNLGR